MPSTADIHQGKGHFEQNEAEDGAYDENSKGQVLLEQERFLPIANISRLIKNMIPSTGKVARDAKECIQECVSEFISFITSEASERCINERRKTITGEDLLAALSALGFDNYVGPLTVYMKKLILFNSAFFFKNQPSNVVIE
ncbi:unnamed protein product [Dracunculus medinensis]|uniref:Nuclear transcription factor Y subunit beta n=1 Tax=Dracunculus medinensis TaxID=318479 RepID=A0A3P7PPH3_DRAME|nr:unnamed protein product [Dracunculus medinensis]